MYKTDPAENKMFLPGHCYLYSYSIKCYRMVCMFIKIKAHKDLLSCRLFHGKLKRQTVDIKKSAFGRFYVFFKTPLLIFAKHKDFYYAVKTVDPIMPAPILHGNNLSALTAIPASSSTSFSVFDATDWSTSHQPPGSATMVIMLLIFKSISQLFQFSPKSTSSLK